MGGGRYRLTEAVRPPTPPPKPSHEEQGLRTLPPRLQSNPRQPPILLRPQPLADAIFDDSNNDHMWVTCPAYRCGSPQDRETSIRASATGRHSGIQGKKGTVDFLRFMACYEEEIKDRLGSVYVPEQSWTNQWWDIICGSNNCRFKLAWTWEQWEPIKNLRPFSKRWWDEVPTPIRVKVTMRAFWPAFGR